jgi:hypothetical protein
MDAPAFTDVNDVPLCDVTGDPVDECDCYGWFTYDEQDEADMRLHDARDGGER